MRQSYSYGSTTFLWCWGSSSYSYNIKTIAEAKFLLQILSHMLLPQLLFSKRAWRKHMKERETVIVLLCTRVTFPPSFSIANVRDCTNNYSFHQKTRERVEKGWVDGYETIQSPCVIVSSLFRLSFRSVNIVCVYDV